MRTISDCGEERGVVDEDGGGEDRVCEGDDGEFFFGESDESGDIHFEVEGANEACLEDGHDGAGTDFAISN